MNARSASLMSFFAVAIFAGLIASTGAMAAEGDDTRGYPALPHAWYVTTPAFVSSGGPPSPYVDESLKKGGLTASYYLPSGSGPSYGQGDIAITAAPISTDTATESIDIDLSAFAHLTTDMGTTFSDGFLVTAKSDKSTEVHPVVTFHTSVLSIKRPAIPTDCKADDPSAYEFQVALLGANGFKYLADVSVRFPERTSSVCASAASPAPVLSAPAQAVDPPSISSPQQISPPSDMTPVIFTGVALLLAFVLAWRFKIVAKVSAAFHDPAVLAARQNRDKTPLDPEHPTNNEGSK
jgi:hypothetical protein